jgi:hypothetical protein
MFGSSEFTVGIPCVFFALAQTKILDISKSATSHRFLPFEESKKKL